MALIEKYAFRGACKTACTNGETVVSGPCYSCQVPQSVTVQTADLAKFRAGNYAQDCFPYLNAAQREFLISGICSKCWDEMFAEDDE